MRRVYPFLFCGALVALMVGVLYVPNHCLSECKRQPMLPENGMGLPIDVLSRAAVWIALP